MTDHEQGATVAAARIATRAVLAAAYNGGRGPRAAMLTHAAEHDARGVPTRALCGRVAPTSLADAHATDAKAPATCPTCAKRDPRFNAPTIAAARAAVRALGFTLSRRDGELWLARRDNAGRLETYCAGNDTRDAIDTAHAIAFPAAPTCKVSPAAAAMLDEIGAELEANRAAARAELEQILAVARASRARVAALLSGKRPTSRPWLASATIRFPGMTDARVRAAALWLEGFDGVTVRGVSAGAGGLARLELELAHALESADVETIVAESVNVGAGFVGAVISRR